MWIYGFEGIILNGIIRLEEKVGNGELGILETANQALKVKKANEMPTHTTKVYPIFLLCRGPK